MSDSGFPLERSHRAGSSTSWLALGLLFVATSLGASAVLDCRLVDALVKEDLAAARSALDAGADPNAVLGMDVGDHAMCAAIDTRGTEALELLLEYDGRVDWVLPEGRRYPRSPLACAMSYYNPGAFDLLLELGADPDADLCPECREGFGHTPLTQALHGSEWPMALELAKRTRLDDVELRTLRFTLEQRPYDAFHPWAPARLALIEWTREQGIAIDPLPMGEGPPGTVPHCVFSTRDMEEGRTQGSICP